MVKVGEEAPDFELVDTELNRVKLSDLRGRKVVLAFYPGAFTSACQKELCAIRDTLANFERLDAQVIGVSVDSPFANKGFAEANRLGFPLLSDYTRDVAQKYGGVYHDFLGLSGYAVAKRAVFIVDEKGIVRYSWISEDPGQEPPYDEVQRKLEGI